MRSGTGTTSGDPGVVTFETNAMMAVFAGPSFHDGNGSAASETAVVNASATTSAAMNLKALIIIRVAVSLVTVCDAATAR
jgi:hypothetical protein